LGGKVLGIEKRALRWAFVVFLKVNYQALIVRSSRGGGVSVHCRFVLPAISSG
jgi:hypothetical protein